MNVKGMALDMVRDEAIGLRAGLHNIVRQQPIDIIKDVTVLYALGSTAKRLVEAQREVPTEPKVIAWPAHFALALATAQAINVAHSYVKFSGREEF